jgi:hypothetical protein
MVDSESLPFVSFVLKNWGLAELRPAKAAFNSDLRREQALNSIKFEDEDENEDELGNEDRLKPGTER